MTAKPARKHQTLTSNFFPGSFRGQPRHIPGSLFSSGIAWMIAVLLHWRYLDAKTTR
jgi:hypothetical protein